MSIKNKVGSPKKYNCDIKTITISIPVLAIPAIKMLIEIEKRKYLVNGSTNFNPTNFIKNAQSKK
jgi:hypothetical protein